MSEGKALPPELQAFVEANRGRLSPLHYKGLPLTLWVRMVAEFDGWVCVMHYGVSRAPRLETPYGRTYTGRWWGRLEIRKQGTAGLAEMMSGMREQLDSAYEKLVTPLEMDG